MCVVLYGAVEHWLSGALVNVGDDDDDDDDSFKHNAVFYQETQQTHQHLACHPVNSH